MCEAVKDELRRYYDNLDGNSGLFKLTGQIRMREGHFPEFTNVDGLNYGIQMRLQQEWQVHQLHGTQLWHNELTILLNLLDGCYPSY